MVGIFASLCFLLGGAANAQEKPVKEAEKEKFVLEEIVVTATYRDTAEMDTPVAMAAADGDMIEDMGLLDLNDLSLSIPSLTVTETASSRNNISIRGIQSIFGYVTASQNFGTTSIYIDDTPVTGGQSPDRQIGGAMFDLERVEVLNGPQGTLFGEGAMAGTIRYITKKPDLSRWAFKVQANVNGMDESGEYGYRIDGMANIPLVQDKFAVRVVGFSTEFPGYLDRITTGEEDINGQTHRGGRLTAKWQATDRLSVRATAYSIETKTESYAWPAGPYYIDTVLAAEAPGSYDEVKQYNLAVEYRFAWADLLSSTSYLERDGNYSQEFIEEGVKTMDWYVAYVYNLGLEPVGDPTGPIPFNWDSSLMNNMTSFSGTDYMATERFVQEFRLVSNTDGPFQWIAGFFYKDSEESSNRGAPFTLTPATQQYAQYYTAFLASPMNAPNNTLEEYALFSEVSYRLTDAWELTAGVRYTDMTQKFELTKTGTEDQRWTPKVSLAWRPTEGMMFFGIVSTGFRPGQYNGGIAFDLGLLEQTMAATGDINLPNQDGDNILISERIADVESKLFFDGDHVINYELGAKASILDSRINLTGSAFYFDWKDTILLLSAGPNTLGGSATAYQVYFGNVGDAHSLGFEASASGMVTRNLFLRLGGRWVEAEIDVPFQVKGGGNDPQPKGRRIPDSPEWKWNVSAAYMFPVTAGTEGEARIDWSGQSESWSDVSNIERVPPYTITNMRLTIRDAKENRWRLSLFARNLFNDEILLWNGGTSAFGTVRAYATPRTYGIEITYEF